MHLMTGKKQFFRKHHALILSKTIPVGIKRHKTNHTSTMPGIGKHRTAGKDGGIYCFSFTQKSDRMRSKNNRAKIKSRPSSTAGNTTIYMKLFENPEQILGDLIRFNTTNPPGNEREAATPGLCCCKGTLM
jgi:hypothetical protein